MTIRTLNAIQQVDDRLSAQGVNLSVLAHQLNSVALGILNSADGKDELPGEYYLLVGATRTLRTYLQMRGLMKAASTVAKRTEATQ